MNIYIDIGNSRFKSAAVTAEIIHPFEPVVWHDSDLEAEFDRLWGEHQPARIVVCNVAADKVLPRLQQWCQLKYGYSAEVIRTSGECRGLVNGYEEPTQLGADRWVAMIGARAHYPGAICVIDSGTATTVDVVTEQGQHLGGAILPGVNTMRRALGKYAAALFTASGDIQPFSTDTASGIAGGTGFASVGAIDRLIDEAARQVSSPTVIFTGGEATLVAPYLRNDVIVDELLVLKGIAALAEDTAESAANEGHDRSGN